MATGIQTSVQRGRRSQLSARPIDKSPWNKARELWGGFNRTTKYLMGGALLALVLAGSYKAHDVRSNRLDDLFPLIDCVFPEDILTLAVARPDNWTTLENGR